MKYKYSPYRRWPSGWDPRFPVWARYPPRMGIDGAIPYIWSFRKIYQLDGTVWQYEDEVFATFDFVGDGVHRWTHNKPIIPNAVASYLEMRTFSHPTEGVRFQFSGPVLHTEPQDLNGQPFLAYGGIAPPDAFLGQAWTFVMDYGIFLPEEPIARFVLDPRGTCEPEEK